MNQNNIDNLTTKANQLLESGDANEARTLYEQICKLEPTNPDAWLMAGGISGELGLTDESIGFIQKALQLEPGFAEAHFTLATLYQNESRIEEALEAAVHALECDEEYPEAWLLRSGLEGRLELYEEVIHSALKTIDGLPDSIDAYINLGNALHLLDRHEEAIERFSHALTLDPDSIPANIGITETLTHLGQFKNAKIYCDRLEKLAPDHKDLIYTRAKLLQREGSNQEAFNLLEPLIETTTNVRAAVTFANACSQLKKESIAIPILEKKLAALPPEKKHSSWHIQMVLGRLYDHTKQYDTAFEHFKQGNSLMTGNFDPAAYLDRCNRIKAFFNSADATTMARSTLQSDLPVFIVGMPRSGTTLTEQILCSHPEIFGAGELTKIGEATRNLELVNRVATEQGLTKAAQGYLDVITTKSGGQYKRVTDKLPGNFIFLGMISLLFPNAKVIHCMRSPIDTCLSCYSQSFKGHEYIHDQSHLGFVYRQYEGLMEHWHSVLQIQILDLHYEDMIDDMEGKSRQLIEFCGLEWHEDCLAFHKNKRLVNTASHDQVNQPIYTKSMERWRNYEKHLGPLIEALDI